MASRTIISTTHALFLLFLLSAVSCCSSASTADAVLVSTSTNKPPSSSTTVKCPMDTLKLGVCADVLNGLLHVVIGTPPKEPCCSLIEGLVDLEAAVCLCTAINANVLGSVNLDINLSLTLLLNYCGKKLPSGYQCP